MDFQKLNDIEIEGIKITNIYRECEYYYRTSGYNYIYFFYCEITDKDIIYNLCKKIFPEGKSHVKYDGTIGTYVVDHDDIISINSGSAGILQECVRKGCNWAYYINEGNDN